MFDADVLFQSFETFNGFSLLKYFAGRYGVIASQVSSYVSAPADPEGFEGIVDMLTGSPLGLEVVQRNLQLGEAAGQLQYHHLRIETPETKDHVPEAMLLNDDAAVICHLSGNAQRIHIEMYHRHGDAGVQEVCANLLREIQTRYSTKDDTAFRVLTETPHGFELESVKLDPVELDVAKLYNDDFGPVDEAVQVSLRTPQSGILLFHGAPGTGKTSYIKHLIAEHPGTNFIYIPNDLVQALLKPNFVAFLIAQKQSVLVIEDGERVIHSREHSAQSSVVSTILQLTDGLFSDFLKIKVICTFNTEVGRIDKALFRKGRLIAFYEFKPLSKTKSTALLHALGHAGATAAAPMTLADIYHYEHTNFAPAEAGTKIGFG